MNRSEYTGAAGLRLLAEDLRELPKTVRREVRPVMREAGQEALREASVNAQWSSRIPRAMKLTTSFVGRRAGVTITVDTSAAPHARPFEGIIRPTFRHPVFERAGRETPWVEQAARPYLLPAARATYRVIAERVGEAVARAHAAHNL